MSDSPNQRLLSLDILRGLDLFLLVFFQPLLWVVAVKSNTSWLNDICYHFVHEDWIGFRFWDLIMPLFLFMAGASIPFAFSKYKDLSNKTPIYRKIIKRFIILYILGMIVQGNLLMFDPEYLKLYSNTLQAIAVGYLITSIVFLNFSIKKQVLAAAVLMLLYWIPVTFLGDFTPENNFAIKLDRTVLGSFMDGVIWDNGTWSFSPNYHYTWIISSLTFAVTVMMGCFAGYIMKNGKNKIQNAKKLLIIGVICILVALVWSLQMPIIKKIWTCTMTLYSGGICFILMAAFYYIIDCKKYSYGLKWLQIFGMNSIATYLFGEVINFRSVAKSVLYGLEHYIPNYYNEIVTFGSYSVLFFILLMMYKHKIFLKV